MAKSKTRSVTMRGNQNSTQYGGWQAYRALMQGRPLSGRLAEIKNAIRQSLDDGSMLEVLKDAVASDGAMALAFIEGVFSAIELGKENLAESRGKNAHTHQDRFERNLRYLIDHSQADGTLTADDVLAEFEKRLDDGQDK